MCDLLVLVLALANYSLISFKLHVSFAKEPYEKDNILQKNLSCYGVISSSSDIPIDLNINSYIAREDDFNLRGLAPVERLREDVCADTRTHKL